MDDDQQTMTRQIVALFIKDASLRVKNIELALGGADSDLSARVVHVLQGAAADVGATALADAGCSVGGGFCKLSVLKVLP